MRELHRTAAFIGGGALVEMVTSVLTSKMASVWLGPAGVGVMGQISNYITLFTTIVGLGLTLGITRAVAKAREEQDQDALGATVTTALLFLLGSGTVVMLGALVFAGPLAQWILGDAGLANYIWLATPGILFAAFYMITDSVCQGLRNARVMARTRIGLALLAPVLLVALVWAGGMTGAATSVAARQVVAGMLAVFLLWRVLRALGLSRAQLRFEPRILRGLVGVGLSTLLVACLWTLANFATRSQLVGELGLAGAGLFQAAWSLVYVLQSLAVSILSYYTFPKISGLKDDAIQGEVLNESIAFGVVILGGGALALSVCREWVMRAFFRDDFLAAADLLPLLGLGGVLYLTWWVVGTPLLAHGRLKAFVALNLVAALPFPLLTALLLPRFGLVSVGLAYVTVNLLTLFVYLQDQYRASRFRLSGNNLVLLGTSVGVFAALLWVPGDSLAGFATRLGLAGLWLGIAGWTTQRYLAWPQIFLGLKTRIRSVKPQTP